MGMDNLDQNARDSIIDIRLHMVRKDVYDAEKALILARVSEVEKDNLSLEVKIDKMEERRAADRRLVFTSLILPIVVAAVILYVQTQIGAA